ncbi:MAG TPA: hypothetical protein VG106_04095 [Vicinamibacterales bacterium]|nr:hypothetical protein [Vicinamibacterales bacterium]
MINRRTRPIAASIAAVCCIAAAHTGGTSASPAADPNRAPARLVDTGLYADGKSLTIDARNRPFVPQYPLWSDGLTKRRWVYLPAGAQIDGGDEDAWDFPVGTRFWKEFSLNDRKVETRLLWKSSPGRWVFATYMWNDEGTDAVLAPESGAPGGVEIVPGRQHHIPSTADCAACHGTRRPAPLGFNALQLSPDRDPHAIHAEPLQPGMITLQTLVEDGTLAGARPDLLARPPRIAASSPTARAIAGYLAANCGICHDGSGEIAAVVPSLTYRDVRDGDAALRRLVDQRSRWQIPGTPEGSNVLVRSGAPDHSVVFVRMRSRSPSSQMPPLGSAVRDQQALEAIAGWISRDPVRSH